VPVAQSSKFNADAVRALPGPALLREQRLGAWERFAASELPSEAEEIWRYSRIDDFDLDRYAPSPEEATTEVELAALPRGVRDAVDAFGPSTSLVLSRNGGPGRVLRPQPGLDLRPASGGPFGAGSAPELVLGGPPPDVWTDLNSAFVRTPWRATVAAGTAVAEPLVVLHWIDCERCAVFPRLEVEVGADASLDLVEIVASPDMEVLAVPSAELVIGPGARLGFGHVQLLGGRAWQLGSQASRVGRDATLRSMTVSLGGSYARVRTDSVLAGPGGDSELLAAYFGVEDQMHDLRTVQHHAAPRSRSNLLFKGAVANRAHSVYSGLIRVEKGAKGTNAFQTNRNLVLSEGAQADSVPNLEIEDNDVRCSHASAVGPIDESQLFYLESRGVPTQTAERLIALGFVDDVLERFPVKGMLAWLRAAVASKLDEAGFGSAKPTGTGQ
jgi:Fe-S cluster assembly protein SufD